MTFEFLVTSLIVVLLPGTGVLYTIAIGLGRGFRASIAAALGCTFGIVPSALASVVGLAALLHTSATVFQLLKFLGVLYLFYMAWNILKEDGAMKVKEDNGVGGFFRIAINGTLLNVLNPKLSLFFLAFLPQFVPASAQNSTAYLLMLAIVFMVMTFIVFVVYGAFAALTRDYVISRPLVLLWMRRVFAASFALLGLRLAFAER